MMRGPTVEFAENKPKLLSLLNASRLGDWGFIDENSLRLAIVIVDALAGKRGQHQLIRAIQFELWMRRAGTGISKLNSAPE